MAVRRLAPPELQPKDFAFTAENAAWAQKVIARYPDGRQQSAIIPLLWRAQEQHDGWLPEAAIRFSDVGAHVRALTFMGGVPAQLVPDNPRVGVDRANWYEPGLNRTYLDLATHYRTAILPTRTRKPRDKIP